MILYQKNGTNSVNVAVDLSRIGRKRTCTGGKQYENQERIGRGVIKKKNNGANDRGLRRLEKLGKCWCGTVKVEFKEEEERVLVGNNKKSRRG